MPTLAITIFSHLSPAPNFLSPTRTFWAATKRMKTSPPITTQLLAFLYSAVARWLTVSPWNSRLRLTPPVAKWSPQWVSVPWRILVLTAQLNQGLWATILQSTTLPTVSAIMIRYSAADQGFLFWIWTTSLLSTIPATATMSVPTTASLQQAPMVRTVILIPSLTTTTIILHSRLLTHKWRGKSLWPYPSRNPQKLLPQFRLAMCPPPIPSRARMWLWSPVLMMSR